MDLLFLLVPSEFCRVTFPYLPHFPHLPPTVFINTSATLVV